MGIDVFEILNDNFGIENSEIKITEIITTSQKEGRLSGKEKFDSLRNKILMAILIKDKSINPYLEVASTISDERSSLLSLANNPYYSTYANISRKNAKVISNNLSKLIHLYQANYDNFDLILDELYSLILNSESHWIFLNNIDDFKSKIDLESNHKPGYLDAELQHLTELTLDHHRKNETINLLKTENLRLREIYSDHIQTALELESKKLELEEKNKMWNGIISQLGHWNEVPQEKSFLKIYAITLVRIKNFLHDLEIFEQNHEYVFFEMALFVNGVITIEFNLKNASWTAEDLGLFCFYLKFNYFNENNYMKFSFEEWFTNIFQVVSTGKTKITSKNLLRYIRPYKGKKSENFNLIRSLFEEVLPQLE